MKYLAQVGEVVLVHGEVKHRSTWKLGIIKNLINGSDGRIRAAEVKVITNCKPISLKRSINVLYPLEINDDDDETGVNDQTNLDYPSPNLEGPQIG
ncbi:Uncharacterised protein r2_g3720 [Pycnogonum litorale]